MPTMSDVMGATGARLAAVREKLLPVNQGVPAQGDLHTKEGQACQEELATLQGYHEANLFYLNPARVLDQRGWQPVHVRLAALEERVNKWVVVEAVGQRFRDRAVRGDPPAYSRLHPYEALDPYPVPSYEP